MLVLITSNCVQVRNFLKFLLASGLTSAELGLVLSLSRWSVVYERAIIETPITIHDKSSHHDEGREPKVDMHAARTATAPGAIALLHALSRGPSDSHSTTSLPAQFNHLRPAPFGPWTISLRGPSHTFGIAHLLTDARLAFFVCWAGLGPGAQNAQNRDILLDAEKFFELNYS